MARLFSIVIATKDRPIPLTACLNAIARLDYPRDGFEVIVVADGPQALESVIAPFQPQFDMILLTQPEAGPAAARNAGAARAKGRFLAFTDDDCEPASNWLRTLAGRFAKASDWAVGGRTITTLSANPYSTASQLLIDYLYSYYNANSNQARFLTSNNLALRADIFHAVGGYKTTFCFPGGEDREFLDRWLYCGYSAVYAPEVLVYHTHPLTLMTFCRQHFNYGRGAFLFYQARTERQQELVRPKPVSFFTNMLRYPFYQMIGGARILLVVTLLVVSQCANVAGYVWARGSKRKKI